MEYKTIDDLLANFDVSHCHEGRTNTEKPLTFWIPIEYKLKYDLIQAHSKRSFGKLLRTVLKKAIDRVNLEDLTEAS